jgi:iron(III) transport system substrate-binding protein
MSRQDPVNALRRHLLGAGAALAACSPVWAQDRSARNRDLYLYQGADREAKLVEGAKKEGLVSIYTSLNTRDSGPITEASKSATASRRSFGAPVPRRCCSGP